MKHVFRLLLLFTFSLPAFSAGNHDHSHEDEQSEMSEDHGHMMHGNEHQGMHHDDHGDGHGHAMSPVGKLAEADAATKTIKVDLLDSMKFVFVQEPDLKAGDVVRFVVTNQGQIPHEFSIGTEAEQDAHREMMRKMPHMQHEDGNTITVQPGETKDLVWQFAGKGEVVFACNIPGHFEAGMYHRSILHGMKNNQE